LWTATEVFLGLRYEAAFVDQLLRGVHDMEESTTYQAIMAKGGLKAVREDICRLGERKFQTPLPAPVRTALEGMVDLEQLHGLLERILDVNGWDELMAEPPRRTPATRRKRK
jgi:hypothetical protein